MNQSAPRHRFIPIRKSDLIHRCLKEPAFNPETRARLSELAQMMAALLHYEFHHKLEGLKDAFAPFNPDTDTQSPSALDEAQRAKGQQALISGLTDLLNAANFEPITEADLQEALAEESLFKVRLAVDFDDFDQILFFRRGSEKRQETVKTWWGLRKKTITFTNYARVVVYLHFKESAYFDQQQRSKLTFTPGATLIKLFRNVPKADLEMLFPNSQVRMKTIDKLVIGVPAAVSGVVLLATKLGATMLLLGSLLAFWVGFSNEPVEINQKHLVALGIAAATLAGFFYKQFSKFKNRKIRFMKTLADNLYFKNLDNNAGVFHHLIDAAEEEEFKEMLLAYVALLKAEEPLSDEQIDAAVEQWLAAQGAVVDFEIEDALQKLVRLGLVNHENRMFRPLPLDQALRKLDSHWDAIFNFQ